MPRRKDTHTSRIFRNDPEQNVMFEMSYEDEMNNVKKDKSVECLGMTFPNDEERRKYFLDILREKLKDLEFRKIEGFPIGEDEDILALSDPPYYTACPNPWIEDFIKEWEIEKSDKPEDYVYHREPFAADVSEGRSGIFYDAHSYHTKVPHKAIMRYILHYTKPGDIVFDGFCGTGMTGVAAQMCGDREVVMSLGYQVKPDGTILQEETDDLGKKVWRVFSKLGVRRAVLNDLSPAATYIAYNYNTPIDVTAFEKEAKRILDEVEKKFGWMYETVHKDGKTKGKVNYIIWSDVFVCPECTREVIFWESAFDQANNSITDTFPCPYCNTELSKRLAERAWSTKYDSAIGESVRQPKQIPALINYTVKCKRAEKIPDKDDIDLIDKISSQKTQNWFPTEPLPTGDKTGEPLRLGISHVHDFYRERSLVILSALRTKASKSPFRRSLYFLINSYDLTHSTMMTRIIFKSGGKKPVLTGYQSGTLYVPSLPVEKNIIEGIRKQKLGIIADSLFKVVTNQVVTTNSTTKNLLPSDVIDYLFIDPPFGSNIMYSELNFLSEAWNKVKTNIKDEAIENRSQSKSIEDYRHLMSECFRESYRVLKPGRWMTVEFHNSKNSVWNSIQESLQHAGFVIADVRTLDKKQGSFNQVTQAGSVKQDIIISCYKPNGGLEERFKLESGSEDGVWDFVNTHLKQLPIYVSKDGQTEVIAERQNFLLFDRMVAFHVQRGVTVPLSAAEFYAGLSQRFPERDGMYFLSEQVAEYDKKRMKVENVRDIGEDLFVMNEESAIRWLRSQLRKKPQTFQDLHPQFLKEIGGWQKFEKPIELSKMLEENFLRYDGKGEVPSQIHSYLSTNFKELRNLPKDSPSLQSKAKDRWYVPDPNKLGDLEKIRERSLLKEFNEYKESNQKRLKVFRLEAVRAGFKKAWQERDYATIIAVAKKIPENVLQEDPKLLMWYDQAMTRSGDGEGSQ